jgi:hypothetical protein
MRLQNPYVGIRKSVNPETPVIESTAAVPATVLRIPNNALIKPPLN